MVWTTTLPELRAKALLKLLGGRQPVQLSDLGEKIGLEIREVASNGFDGALVRIANQPTGVIAVRKNMPPSRKRFTIAHEIGHFVLPGHDDESRICGEEEIERAGDDQDDVEPGGEADSLLEQAANEFASELLMPSPVIRRIVMRLGISIDTCELIGKLFQVSLTAAATRCVEEDEAQYNGSALVVSKSQVVKYYVKSTAFSEYIEINRPIPRGSLAKQVSAGGARKKVGLFPRVFGRILDSML